jgi:hypothetical protein
MPQEQLAEVPEDIKRAVQEAIAAGASAPPFVPASRCSLPTDP